MKAINKVALAYVVGSILVRTIKTKVNKKMKEQVNGND